jgi:hypothetical protein
MDPEATTMASQTQMRRANAMDTASPTKNTSRESFT